MGEDVEVGEFFGKGPSSVRDDATTRVKSRHDSPRAWGGSGPTHTWSVTSERIAFGTNYPPVKRTVVFPSEYGDSPRKNRLYSRQTKTQG